VPSQQTQLAPKYNQMNDELSTHFSNEQQNREQLLEQEWKILDLGFELVKLWTEFDKSKEQDKEKQKEIEKMWKQIDKDQKELG